MPIQKFPLYALILLFHEGNGQITLPKLNINPEKLTISGFSSGAAMASQFHFAHSKEVAGVGIFSGIPYLCGVGGLSQAQECMNSPENTNISELIREIEKLDNIDCTSYIRNRKVYIFHGSKDSLIRPESGEKLKELYDHYVAEIRTEFDIPAEHGQPTDNYGAPCGNNSFDFGYINNCDYNGAFEMLNYLYGDLTRPNKTELLGDFSLFDQSEFAQNPSNISLDNEGFVYIPSGCKSGERMCSLQIIFHGCDMYRERLGDIYATKSGFLEVAELNNIVLIFPQTVISPNNSYGCWDWWGYLDHTFPTKQGDQIQAIYGMANRVMNG